MVFGWQNRWNDLRRFKYFLYFTSIDGIPEYSNKMRGNPEAFEKAIKGLELFGKLRVPVRIVNTVVHPGNIDQLGRLMEILRNSAATLWRLSPIAKIGRAANESKYNLTGKQLRYVADFIRRNRSFMNIDFNESNAYLGCFLGNLIGRPLFCGAGLTRCSIMPDGEVLGCQQVYDRSFSEGNIRNKPFPQIWKEGFSRFRKKRFPSHLPELCSFEWMPGRMLGRNGETGRLPEIGLGGENLSPRCDLENRQIKPFTAWQVS